jgi:hypothetical protein
MWENFLFYFIFGVIILLGIWLLWYFGRPKKRWLTSQKITYYKNQIKRVRENSSTERILQYDKILSYILAEYGYEWTLGDQLKSRPHELYDIEEVWRLHKLRNKLAHDLHELSESTLKKEATRYEKLLFDLL